MLKEIHLFDFILVNTAVSIITVNKNDVIEINDLVNDVSYQLSIHTLLIIDTILEKHADYYIPNENIQNAFFG